MIAGIRTFPRYRVYVPMAGTAAGMASPGSLLHDMTAIDAGERLTAGM